MEEIQWYKDLFCFGLTTGRTLFQVVFLLQCNVPPRFLFCLLLLDHLFIICYIQFSFHVVFVVNVNVR